MTSSTRLSNKNCFEEGGGEGMRRIKRDSDNCCGDDQDDDKDDHYQEDGWMKEGMPEL